MSGLFGTRAPLPSDLSLVVQGIVAVILIAGFWNVRRGRIDNHRRLMTAAFALGLLSTLVVMVPAIFAEAPADLSPMAAQILPGIRPGHALLGALTLLSALYLVVVMRSYPQPHPRRIGRFKRLMQATLTIWLLTVVGGAVLYFVTWIA